MQFSLTGGYTTEQQTTTSLLCTNFYSNLSAPDFSNLLQLQQQIPSPIATSIADVDAHRATLS
jgi:hypothetical protein